MVKERLLPRALGNLHPRRYAPSLASLVQTGVGIVVVGAFALAGMDPYYNLATSATGVGTLGVLTLQALAAAAVVGYFRRVRGDGNRDFVVAQVVIETDVADEQRVVDADLIGVGAAP